MKKRIAAVLLVFTLLGGMLPAVAWGEYSPHEGSPGYYLHDGTSPDEAYFAEPPQQVMEFVFAYLQANHASVAGGAVGRGLGQVVDETVSHPLGDFTVMHFVIENSVLHMDILVQLDFVPYSTDYVMDMPFLHFHVRNPHAVLYYAALCEYGYEMQAAPPVSVNFTGRGDGEFMLSVEQVLWSGEDALAELEVYFEAFSITRHCRTCFLSQEILREDLGFNFTFHMLKITGGNAKGVYDCFKDMNPKLTMPKAAAALALCVRTIYAMDGVERYIRENIGFELEDGALEAIEKEFLKEIEKADSVLQIGGIYKRTMKKLEAVPINKPADAIKIGVVGELYVLMEPFSNYFIEKELAKFGVQVTRFITASYLIFSPQHNVKKILSQAEGYCEYEIGADGTDSVGKSVVFAKEGYDGILHLKPFGCTPEINSIPIVQRVSEDYEIPVLYFSFDSQTSETGVKTRLEAFYDMIQMKKGGKLV